MDKNKAIELLKQCLDRIPKLRTVNYNSQDFPLWKSKITDIIKAGLDPEDLDTFNSAHREDNTIYVLQPGVDRLPNSKFYLDEITAKETALKSIIQKYELHENNSSHLDSMGEEQSVKNIKLQKTKSIKTNNNTIWEDIFKEFDMTKKGFGRKINFVKEHFKREIIFRDVEQAFVLKNNGFSKPAVILAGGVIEELLRLYLEDKHVKPIKCDFNGYIQTCEQQGLLKAGISRLSDSVRHFRNLVHLSNEKTKRYTISKSTAIGAVASIFTIANDFSVILPSTPAPPSGRP